MFHHLNLGSGLFAEFQEYREPLVTLWLSLTDGEKSWEERHALPASAAASYLLLGEHGFDQDTYALSVVDPSVKRPPPAVTRARILYGNEIDRFGGSP